MLDSPEAVAEKCDAILLTAVDGRAHLDLFKRIAPLKKPTFIDKPFAVSSADAKAMFALAKEHGTPLMSSSSLRYAQPVVDTLEEVGRKDILCVDACGPMSLEASQNNIYWYGIHSVELLFAAMGAGCVQVQAVQSGDYELLSGLWSDGRVASVRGDHTGKFGFYLTLQTPTGAPIANEETLEIIRFIEAANQSRETGAPVKM